MRGTWRKGSFTGDPERYVKAPEWVSVSIGATLLGNTEGCSFLRAFEIKRYIKRYVKMPCKQVSLSTGPGWGTWREFACQDFLREKESISEFLSWTQRTFRF